MDFLNDRNDSCVKQGQNHNHLQTHSDFFPAKVSDVFCEVTLNQEDHSYMFDEASTPSKACEGLAYHNTCVDTNKEPEEQKETRSALKRRRLLFDYQDSDSLIDSGQQQSSSVLDPNDGKDPFDEILPYGSQIVPAFSVSEDASASSFEGLSLSASEEWISECFNNPEMQFIDDNLDLSCTYDEQIDVSEFLNVPPDPETEANMVRKLPTRAYPNIVIRERKSSFASVPAKLPSSVVYPFAFIKPCGVHGDITLQDINQRIQTPRSEPKLEDPPVYQTSAFSGKPVVVKTKIQTEGGKGSITIMRTRG